MTITDARFTQDEYGVVENSPQTYRAIYNKLISDRTVLMGWTDNAMSHMDILLALPDTVGPLNRLDARPVKLVVGVVGYGLFAFAVQRNADIHHSYLAAKLGMRPTKTTEALAELVLGVMAELCPE